MRALVIAGTRPEAIKLFRVVHALRDTDGCEAILCTSGQHDRLAREVLDFAGLTPDIALPSLDSGQPLAAGLAVLIERLREVIERVRPDWVVVQGDTNTTLAGALAAHARTLPVAHVEAGLRTPTLAEPWPEEGYRRAVSAVTTLHFAPTEAAAAALRAENIAAEAIHAVGNTVIDALHWTRERLRAAPSAAVTQLTARFSGRRLALVTAHRRESFGAGMAGIAEAIDRLSRREDLGILVARHPNPEARRSLEALPARDGVALIDPLPYADFVGLLDRVDLVLTDSGGIQEEAPALGTPVVVLRDVTERPEAVDAGTAILAGTKPDSIVTTVAAILDDPGRLRRMSVMHSPYGDGRAAGRIAGILATARRASDGGA